MAKYLTCTIVFRFIVFIVATTVLSSVVAEDRASKKARLLKPTSDFSVAEPFEIYQGGSGTNLKQLNRNAFSQPSSVLSFEQRSDFFVGNGVFDRPWVTAPSSTISSDGLGPLFNARSCQGCHIKDGRGHPPQPGDTNMVSMLFSLSDRQGKPDPHLGRQLQDQATAGMSHEGNVNVHYVEQKFRYPDGQVLYLRKPRYSTDAKLGQHVSLNPRIAPPMIGLGLIESVMDEDILANEDILDTNGDGISGRANKLAGGAIGRFGWKASEPSVLEQVATAFHNDMGLSTRLRPSPHGDCTATQSKCIDAIHGAINGAPEVEDVLLNLVEFYSANLAVPARRGIGSADVLKGKQLFYKANCIACHVPKLATDSSVAKEQRNQLIWPYSDFLLHDMGPGLADENPSGDVAATEWRTQPLWGIGLTETVNGHSFFLHDGRARSLEEAILWHGGESSGARKNFVNYTEAERRLLIRFLESL